MTSTKFFDAFSLVVTLICELICDHFRGQLVVTRGHSWSFVVTRGHSCVLLDTTSLKECSAFWSRAESYYVLKNKADF